MSESLQRLRRKWDRVEIVPHDDGWTITVGELLTDEGGEFFEYSYISHVYDGDDLGHVVRAALMEVICTCGHPESDHALGSWDTVGGYGKDRFDPKYPTGCRAGVGMTDDQPLICTCRKYRAPTDSETHAVQEDGE